MNLARRSYLCRVPLRRPNVYRCQEVLKCDRCGTKIMAFVLLSLFDIYCKIWYILKYDNPTKYKNDNFIPRNKELYPGYFLKLRRHLYICIPSSIPASGTAARQSLQKLRTRSHIGVRHSCESTVFFFSFSFNFFFIA